MAKTKRQLADEAYLRSLGQTMEMFDDVAAPVPVEKTAPDVCGGCGMDTRPVPHIPGGRWNAMRSGLSDERGNLQCSACAHIVSVPRAEWDRIALRNSRSYSDTGRRGRPKPGRESKYDRDSH